MEGDAGMQEPSDELELIRWRSEKDKLPPWVLWSGVVVLFGMVHCRYETLVSLAQSLLARTVPSFYEHVPKDVLTERYVENLVCIKGFLFYIAAGILFLPIVRSVWLDRSSLRAQYDLVRLAKRSVVLMLVLAALIVPVHVPYLVDAGTHGLPYSVMSMSPFSKSTDLIYRRLLTPALAYLLQMKGLPLYYVFSLACTFGLIFLTLLFLEIHVRGGPGHTGLAPALKPSLWGGSGIWILSLATSSFIMFDFQSPGYVEHLFYILTLLAVCVPMTTGGLLAVVALSLAAHEISVLTLVPLVLLAFPKQVRWKALCVVALYFLMWLMSLGFNVKAALMTHNIVVNQAFLDTPSVIQSLTSHPLRILSGIFFAYKLWWVLAVVAAWMLYKEGKTRMVRFILGAILLPLVILPIAYDTSRLASMGFLGVLLAACYLVRRYRQTSWPRWLQVLLLLNIAIPSFYADLYRGLHLPWGLYRVVVELVKASWHAI
ncbi:MAG: hypothetical protein ABSH10_03565 [Phycisphaerae bacterium]|jgi:hypothetical protein